MRIRPGKSSDFIGVDSLVTTAIADAFYRLGLTPEQEAENRHIVNIAQRCCDDAITDDRRIVFSALGEDEELLGFVIVDHRDPAWPEIDWLIVSIAYQGKGVAVALMQAALHWIGSTKPVRLGVIHFNSRAIAFYRKFGFVETGEVVGRHAIPRLVMRRPAVETTGD